MRAQCRTIKRAAKKKEFVVAKLREPKCKIVEMVCGGELFVNPNRRGEACEPKYITQRN